jgi:thymidylate kinase
MLSFLYLAGCDGVGKSTQAQILTEELYSRGLRVRRIWLRYPFFFSLPFLVYARVRGFSWREVNGSVVHGYWDFSSSWLMQKVFPWFLLLDTSIAAFWKVRLPLWRGYSLICERYVIDILVDLFLGSGDFTLYNHLLGKLFLRLVPKSGRVIVLDSTVENIRNRREDLTYDRRLEEKTKAYHILANDLGIDRIQANLSIKEITNMLLDEFK